jgi:multidrug efflux pump subunit AcrA (membrane-fusion protein)
MKNFLTLIIFSVIFISCNKKLDPHAGHNHGADDHSGHNHANDDHSGHNHGADDHAGHNHGSDDHNSTQSNVSSQALKNMGVKIEAVDSSNYTVYTPVPAVIMEDMLNEQPVFAPFGGRVKSIEVVIGEYKKSATNLLTLYRDPIKRPELKLVEAILTPASEEYHTAIASLRQNLKLKELLSTELKRLMQFQKDSDSLTIVPKKDLIDLRYDIEKAKRSIENSRKKLDLHGLSKEEISQVEKGKFILDLYQIWKNALISNNIWNKGADVILGCLNKKLQNNRWTVATIGELVANDQLSEQLISWMVSDANAATHFLEIVSLFQAGHSISDLKNLHSQGAFNAVIEVKSPISEMGWDVEKLLVKQGQKIEAGQSLLVLTNQSKMLLVSYPQSSEIVDMANAGKNNLKISASTLIPQAGPLLTDLTINKIRGTDENKEQVLISVKNTVQGKSSNDKNSFRTWSLRNGLKYVLKVPVKMLEDVIVLPREAVISHGADKIVFVRENGEYIRRKVVVVHEDSEFAVIGEGSELLPDEEMVVSGAFALQLALVAGTPEAVDPHAGHNH